MFRAHRPSDKKSPAKSGACNNAGNVGLVVANAEVIPPPPIRAAGDFGPIHEPSAIVASVIVWPVNPNPHAVAEDAVPIELIMVVITVGEVPVVVITRRPSVVKVASGVGIAAGNVAAGDSLHLCSGRPLHS